MQTASTNPGQSKGPSFQAALRVNDDVDQHGSPVTTYGPYYKSDRNQRSRKVLFYGNVPRADIFLSA